jgi:serine/threonine-protein kinase RsbW
MRDKQVRVRAVVSDAALVLEVADEGSGFDMDACTVDPTSPGNLEREDGRGLFLMRSLMDRVERYEANARNVVRLTLNRS